MKKKQNSKIKVFFILTIITFCFITNLFAADVIIGTGLGTDYNPFYQGYDYAYEVNLYKSAEIGSSFTIQRMEWFSEGGATTINAVKIYVKDISDATVPNETWTSLISGATLVYSGNITFSAQGWGGMNLSSTFAHNNSYNLLVMCLMDPGSTGSGSFTYTQADAGSYTRKYSTGGEYTGTFGGSGSYRANIRLKSTTAASSPAPAEPTINASTNIGETGFTVNWNAVAGAEKYYLYIGTSYQFTTTIGSYNALDVGNVTSYDVTGLTQGTNYYIAVRSYTTDGWMSGRNYTQTQTDYSVPSPPISNAASGQSSTSFVASWNSALYAAGYYLDVSTSNTFPSYVNGYNGLDISNITSYRVTGLNPGTTYYYRIRAYSPGGSSSNSPTQTVSTNSEETNKTEFSYTGSDQTWTAPVGVQEIYVQCWGAGGGEGAYACAYPGGSGGYSSGTIPVTQGTTYTIVAGQGGIGVGVGYYTDGGTTTYGGGGYGTKGAISGGSGGGLSGFFTGNTPITFDAAGQSRALLIAGGGGGSTGSTGAGGPGGGTTGVSGGTAGGNGGTQVAGGTGTAGADGSAMQGGNGGESGFYNSGTDYGGGGGGGGYYGGEGGYSSGSNGGGGGGSGYIHGSVTGGITTAGIQGAYGSASIPPNNTDPNYLSSIGVGFEGDRILNTNGFNGGHGLVVLSFTPLRIPTNLLDNAGGELGSFDSWTITANGGNGWAVPINSNFEGNYLYVTSYGWDRKTQTIDLLAKGYTTSNLDAAPKIYVECWVYSNNDWFNFYVKLLNGASGEITSYNTGDIQVAGVQWTKYSYTFTGYGTGLRYIYFENGGRDIENWAGHYGSIIDGELVLLDNTWNDAPYISLEGTVNYNENSGTSVLSVFPIIRDIDSNDFNGGILTIDLIGNTSDYDSFSIMNIGTGSDQINLSGNNILFEGTTIGTFSGGSSGNDSLIITLNSNSDTRSVENLIKNIVYENRSDAPEDSIVLRIQLYDGDGDTGQYLKTINFTKVNDSPILSLTYDTANVIIGNETIFVFTNLNISDSDAMDSITNITVTFLDTDFVRLTFDTTTYGIDTVYINAVGDTVGTDTFTIKISDSSGAFDTGLFAVTALASAYTGPQWFVSSDTGSDIFNNGSETYPFQTITKAVSKCAANDTINIFSGTYNETIVITQNGVSLIGTDSSNVIIHPVGDSSIITLYGIYANGLTNLRIENLQVTDCYNGIHFYNVDTSIIDNVTAQYCGGTVSSAILLYTGSCSNIVQNCYVTNSYKSYTISTSGKDNIIQNCVAENFENLAFYVYSSTYNTITNCIARYGKNYIGYYLVTSSNYNTLTNNIADSCGVHGFCLYGSSGNTAANNTSINNSGYGFIINSSALNNIITDNISNNNIIGGFYVGTNSNENIFLRNSANLNNSYGFYLLNGAQNNSFYQNDIRKNVIYQIYITGNCIADTFICNNIELSGTSDSYIYVAGDTYFTFTDNYFYVTDSSIIREKIIGNSVLYTPYSFTQIDTSLNADTISPEAPEFYYADTSVLKEVTLRWNKPVTDNNGNALSGLAGYRIYRIKDSPDTDNWENFLIETLTDINDTEFTDTAYSSAGIYYYRITAYDSHYTNAINFQNISWYSSAYMVDALYNILPETPVLLTPVNLPAPFTEYDTYGRTLNSRPNLIWECPNDADSDALYFKVFIDSGFGVTELANSENNVAGFFYYNSGTYDTLPVTGADSSVYGNTVYYTPQTDLNDSVYAWTIIAYDSDLYSDSIWQSFKVGGRIWTDSPLVAGTTLIRKIHIDELREEANFARNCRGLADYSWTDPTIVAGETLIRKVYIDELRTSIAEYKSAGHQSAPAWSGTITAGQTLIKTIYFEELRNNLK